MRQTVTLPRRKKNIVNQKNKEKMLDNINSNQNNKKKVVGVRRISRGKWLTAGFVGIVGVTVGGSAFL